MYYILLFLSCIFINIHINAMGNLLSEGKENSLTFREKRPLLPSAGDALKVVAPEAGGAPISQPEPVSAEYLARNAFFIGLQMGCKAAIESHLAQRESEQGLYLDSPVPN